MRFDAEVDRRQQPPAIKGVLSRLVGHGKKVPVRRVRLADNSGVLASACIFLLFWEMRSCPVNGGAGRCDGAEHYARAEVNIHMDFHT